METCTLEQLLSDRALLVAVCESLAKSMNARAMWRLAFLLEELALDRDASAASSGGPWMA